MEKRESTKEEEEEKEVNLGHSLSLPKFRNLLKHSFPREK